MLPIAIRTAPADNAAIANTDQLVSPVAGSEAPSRGLYVAISWALDCAWIAPPSLPPATMLPSRSASYPFKALSSKDSALATNAVATEALL